MTDEIPPNFSILCRGTSAVPAECESGRGKCRRADVSAPQLIVREVRLYERDVHLRMPFRFGVVTLTRGTTMFRARSYRASRRPFAVGGRR